MSTGWDNATLKKLKNLVGKGLSTSEIGKRLGMSKNAVVGKLNRLGWNAKAGTISEPQAKNTIQKTVAKKTESKKSTPATKNTTTKSKTKVEKKEKEAAPAKVVNKVTTKADTTQKKQSKDSQKTTKNESIAVETDDIKESKNNAKNLALHQRIIQHSLEMASLRPNQCRWPIGDPDSDKFHFCGETVFVGKPYCYEHCKQAYQFTPPKKK